MSIPLRLTALVSGSGTLLQALLDNQDENYTVDLVVSDRECPALDRARAVGVKTAVVPMRENRASWDEELANAVGKPDLIVSAGFMKIPGAHAVRDALEYGVKVTGSTVHYVDEGVDTGPIIAQRAVKIHAGEGESALHERIKQVERELLVSLLRSATVDDASSEVVFHHD